MTYESGFPYASTPRRGRVDLAVVLHGIGAEPGAFWSELVGEIAAFFGCSRRSASDALHILRSAGWIEARRDETDKRKTRYSITPLGREMLETGVAVVRRAGRWHSSCSPSARRRQRNGATHAESVPFGESYWKT